MTTKIHPTAIIDPTAELGEGVEIGPYAFIGAKVTLGDRVKVGHAATIEGVTVVGEETRIWPHAMVGADPQDLKYNGEESCLEIGARGMIREFASLHRGTVGGGLLTRIGDDVLIMNGGHVGHDAQVGNNCIIAAQSALGGHVVMGDHAIIGGITGIHQWVHIGAHAMVAGGIFVHHDVPTYAVVNEEMERMAGVNVVGLRRRGFSRASIQKIMAAMKLMFLERDEQPLAEALEEAQTLYGDDPGVQALLTFTRSLGASDKKRGFASPR